MSSGSVWMLGRYKGHACACGAQRGQGGMHGRDICRELQVDALGFVGGGLQQTRVTRGRGREAGGANADCSATMFAILLTKPSIQQAASHGPTVWPPNIM